MRLSVGMAVHNDLDGVLFTAAAALLYHPVDEVLVVDNAPDTPHGQATRTYCASTGGKVRYVPFTAAIGTAAPRNEVFRQATGDVVVCCDSHVLFPPGSLAALRSFYTDRPDCPDLVQGPLVYDDLANTSTHFDLSKWDGEMWGQWAYDDREKAGEPFEIPAQGLGVFACRRDAWLGFSPKFRGFGGEEGYIHVKYRLAGRRAICLPQLRWFHRFHRPNGAGYPLNLRDKVRNYVIGFQELGLDLEPCRAYWVGSGKVPQHEWDHLVAHGEFPAAAGGVAPGCSACNGQPLRDQPSEGVKSLEDLFDWVKSKPRDLDQHADRIRGWSAKAKRVAAFVKRREWNVLLAAARPDRLVVYQDEGDPLLDRVHAAVLAANTADPPVREYTTHVAGPGADSLSATIAECDLLVLDTVHHADRLYAELTRHAPQLAGRVLLRGTGAFGEMAEGGQGPGLLPAVRRFVAEHPEWTVIEHVTDQYGVTVLSKLPEDKKPLPPKWKQAVNAAKAAWRNKANILDYGPLKDTPAQTRRLALCLLCPEHTDGRCAACGCPVDRKTSYANEFCPLAKWPAGEAEIAGDPEGDE
jgi:hypothetical protein